MLLCMMCISAMFHWFSSHDHVNICHVSPENTVSLAGSASWHGPQGQGEGIGVSPAVQFVPYVHITRGNGQGFHPPAVVH